MSYLAIVTLVFLNLFIAIIINGYLETQTEEDSAKKGALKMEQTEEFLEAWAILDPDATGKILAADFEKFMYILGEPLGWHEAQLPLDAACAWQRQRGRCILGATEEGGAERGEASGRRGHSGGRGATSAVRGRSPLGHGLGLGLGGHQRNLRLRKAAASGADVSRFTQGRRGRPLLHANHVSHSR